MGNEPDNLVLVFLRRIDGAIQDLQRGQAENLTRLTRLNRLEEG